MLFVSKLIRNHQNRGSRFSLSQCMSLPGNLAPNKNELPREKTNNLVFDKV